MKLTLHHFDLSSTKALDSWIERHIVSLQPRLQIDEASVRLAYRRDASPAYRVNVHLVTPGPDVFAEGCDHTLRAAFGKMMTALKNKLSGRDAKRLCRLKSNLQSPATQSRNGRRG